jgi:hypothetical protein
MTNYIKYRNKLSIFPLLLLTLLFQSCFEIIEEVKMKDDGSGHFNFAINLSQSKTKINSLLKMDKINGYPIPSKEKIRKEIATIENFAQNTVGITNVNTKVDLNNYIVEIDFDFNNVNNLNAVFSKLKKNSKTTEKFPNDYYTYSNKKFIRTQKIPIKALYDKLGKADKELFENAKYTSIYKFDTTIKEISNQNAALSKSKKAIKLNGSVLDIIKGNKKIENTITLN